jgi:(E)-4-hydroxy-3-methylbut-2-enyl-diphosphate synthase
MTTKNVCIQGLLIGKQYPVRVESMLKVPLSDPEGCQKQLDRLEQEKCELVRIAFPSIELSDNLRMTIKNPRLAIEAIEAGCRAIRINPGNMGSTDRLMDVIHCAVEHETVIRIGANSGSLNEFQLQETNGNVAQALFLAVEQQIHALTEHGFENIILSAKSTNVLETVESNYLLHSKYPLFPLHIGITEAGPGFRGIAKSAAGLSLLLSQGIGDTMRVSLTEPPELEVAVAYEILRSLGLRNCGPEIISCPTCGRKRIQVSDIVEDLEPLFKTLPDGFKVAVMGCEVNGPREARNADLGIAGTLSGFVVFRKGKVIRNCRRDQLPEVIAALANEIDP